MHFYQMKLDIVLYIWYDKVSLADIFCDKVHVLS